MVSYEDPQENKGNDSITAEEAKHHIQFIENAKNSDNPERSLIEGFMNFGPRFATTLRYCAQLARNDGGYFQRLADQSIDILAEWLTGKKMTDRADEAERRVIVAKSIVEHGEFGGLERLAAVSILELPEDHPLRDVSFAHQGFLRQIERCRIDSDIDGLVITIKSLLDARLEPVEKSLMFIEEASQILMQVSDPDTRRDFLIAEYAS